MPRIRVEPIGLTGLSDAPCVNSTASELARPVSPIHHEDDPTDEDHKSVKTNADFFLQEQPCRASRPWSVIRGTRPT